MQGEPNLDEFLVSISTFTFQEKFFKWQAYLNSLRQKQSQYYRPILETFVEHYPFNHTHWVQLCQAALKQPKGKEFALKLYQAGLSKNPRSIHLWQSFLTWLQKSVAKTDPSYLKKQLEKATRMIGNHYKASFIFERYFELEKDHRKKYETMKKSLVSPLEEIDKIYDIIATYIDTELPQDLLEAIAAEEGFIPNQKQRQDNLLQTKEYLKASLRKLYEPTKKHVEMRYNFQAKITATEYQPYADSIENWRNYIHFIKNSGNAEFLAPIYERALISQCDNEALWEEYFFLLENNSNQRQILYLLRSHATFFRNLSRELTYYWLEMEERENPVRARQLYIDLEKKDYHLETFLRHIQLQLRSKDYNNAKVLYETMLTVFTANAKIVTYILIEFSEFCIKYFRDVDFAKKLLSNFFQFYPYNESLFLYYIQFFIKNVEYKQGTGKEAKETYDLFVSILVEGLKRAIANDPTHYKTLSKVVKKYLRAYVQSIYLVKMAERKIEEVEFKKQENENGNKRQGQPLQHLKKLEPLGEIKKPKLVQ